MDLQVVIQLTASVLQKVENMFVDQKKEGEAMSERNGKEKTADKP